MRNSFTKGTKGFFAAHHCYFPIREDRAIACSILNYDPITKILQAKKLWDEADTALTALVIGGTNLNPNEKVILQRVPAGWLAFSLMPTIFVQDLGNETGQEVKYINKVWVNQEEILPLETVEPVSFFHNSKPPFLINRIYWAQKIENTFFVWLSGLGPINQTFTQVQEGDDYEYTLNFDTDAQGNILDFTASAIDLIPPADWKYLFNSWLQYLPGAAYNQYTWATTEIVGVGHICYYEAKALNSPPWQGHDPAASDWGIREYSNYNSVTKEFSNFQNQNQECIYGRALGGIPSTNTIKVKCPGTGIVNKDSYFSNFDVYLDPNIAGKIGYIQFIEKGSPTYGNRSGIHSGAAVPMYFYWHVITYFWPYYNEASDSVSNSSIASSHMCVDGGRKTNGAWGDNAHYGHNDDARGVMLYDEAAPGMGLPVPGWPEIPNARFYYCGTVNYNLGHNQNGGRYYFSRQAGDWKEITAGSWQTCTPGTKAIIPQFADKWKSVRFSSCNYNVGRFYLI